MYTRNDPSPLYLELLALYVAWHKSSHKHFRGGWGGRAHKKIVELVRQTHSHTLLDYGCGKGIHFANAKMSDKDKELLDEIGCKITGYDPACPLFNVLPQGKLDGVIVLDVMEHIPEEDVSWVLEEILRFGRKFVFFLVTTVPARKSFHDGRNVHITIKSEEWWRKRITDAKKTAKSRVRVEVSFRDRVQKGTEVHSPASISPGNRLSESGEMPVPAFRS